MKKNLFAFFVVVLGVTIAILYGVIHDLLTFKLSPEFYYRYQYYKYNLIAYNFVTEVDYVGYKQLESSNDFLAVIICGFKGTWWVGLLLGVIVAFLSYIQNSFELMVACVKRAIAVNVIICLIFSLLGYVIASIYKVGLSTMVHMPEKLKQPILYLKVSVIHGFSYFGAIMGLIVVCVLLLKEKINTLENHRLN